MCVAIFKKIGLGHWFRYFTGGLEVVGAILVLVPRTAGFAATLLGMTMVGAVDIHLLITGGNPVSLSRATGHRGRCHLVPGALLVPRALLKER
jgi:uncharacterized membrane protein YphA (DoxX/SURF4 family)